MLNRRGCFGALAALFLLAALGLWLDRPHTHRPPGPSAEREAAVHAAGGDPNSIDGIADLAWMDFDGDLQSVLIRGADRTAPVVLFLHGGPGMPAMYLAHDFQEPLERDFVVVQWDRRAAGKSFDDAVTPEQISVSRLLADAEILLDSLEARFGPEPVVLVGHSWGELSGHPPGATPS